MTPRFVMFEELPDAVKGMAAVALKLHQGKAGEELIELGNIRASQINGCAYCLQMHITRMREIGYPQRKLDLIAGWRETPDFTPRERAVLGWAEELTRLEQTQAGDAAYAALEAVFDRQEIAEITFALAVIYAWNRIQVASRGHPQPG